MSIDTHKNLIAFTEGTDENTILCAYNLANAEICRPVLFGIKSKIYKIAEKKGIDLENSQVDIIDHTNLVPTD